MKGNIRRIKRKCSINECTDRKSQQEKKETTKTFSAAKYNEYNLKLG